MKNYYLVALLFLGISFFSFSSENKSENLPKKEISKPKVIPQKKENSIQFNTHKLNFKERLALKLVQHKIKKVEKKQTKSIKSNGKGIISTILISALLILGGLVGGIIYLSLGETLLGILLLFGALIVVPLILTIILIHLISQTC